MKRTTKPDKKLSLKKLQLIKISNMKTIKGGNNQLNINGDDEPPTQIPQSTSISIRN